MLKGDRAWNGAAGVLALESATDQTGLPFRMQCMLCPQNYQGSRKLSNYLQMGRLRLQPLSF